MPKTTEPLPTVAIIVPCLNEAKFIANFVSQVLALDYPPELSSVYVVDGTSTDGTREILGRLAASEPRLHVLDNPARTTACALNRALRASQSEVVLRLDVHADYPRNYLRHLVELLQGTQAANVGALRITAAGSSLREQLFSSLISSPFANGGAPWRSRPRGVTEVESVYCGCYPRRIFEQVGLFDEKMIRIEDREFNARVRAAGGRILLDPSLTCTYHPRTRLGPYIKWTFSGPFRLFYSRCLTTTRLVHLRNYVPLCFAIYHVLLPVGWWMAGYWALAPLACYLVAATGAAMQEARLHHRVAVVLPLVSLFYLTHIVYGLGGLWGALRSLLPLPPPRPENKFAH
jgi:cellulose synthase/poly-beta-1,6-N-acetylglucosamine synthase-like glycosyltransferase